MDPLPPRRPSVQLILAALAFLTGVIILVVRFGGILPAPKVEVSTLPPMPAAPAGRATESAPVTAPTAPPFPAPTVSPVTPAPSILATVSPEVFPSATPLPSPEIVSATVEPTATPVASPAMVSPTVAPIATPASPPTTVLPTIAPMSSPSPSLTPLLCHAAAGNRFSDAGRVAHSNRNGNGGYDSGRSDHRGRLTNRGAHRHSVSHTINGDCDAYAWLRRPNPFAIPNVDADDTQIDALRPGNTTAGGNLLRNRRY
jgi:hypothetical protein